MQNSGLRRIPLLDLRAQFEQIREEAIRAVTRICESQELILGREVREFEEAAAAYCSAKHAIGCASGSDAILLALMAYDIQPGDHVLTTPFTFFATAAAIVRLGAVPVFVDIDPRTFNIDTGEAIRTLEATDQARAIIPVDLYGGCADMDPLLEAARARGIPVIDDAAQSIGAEYQGRRTGSLTDVTCFSFYPSKNLGAFGDGGLLATGNDAVAERLFALRVHGSRERYLHEWLGINSRLDAMQAAVLKVKLPHLDRWTAARQAHAATYRRLFSERSIPVRTPEPAPYQTRHVYNQFIITCDRRDELRRYLAERNIGSEVYYPMPLHLQPCFAGLGYGPGDFPVSEQMSKQVLALPVYPELEDEDLAAVVNAVAAFYA